MSIRDVVTSDVLRPLAREEEFQTLVGPHLPPTTEQTENVVTSPQFQQVSSSVCLSVLVYLSVSVCLFICVCLSVYLCWSVCLFVCVCLSICICPSIYLSIYVCLSIYLSACLSVCLSVYFCMYHSIFHDSIDLIYYCRQWVHLVQLLVVDS